MSESDREKFKRLANKRVSAALKKISLIGNLSNRSNYVYTEEDVNKIFTALNEEIQAAKKLFDTALLLTGKKHTTKFKLD